MRRQDQGKVWLVCFCTRVLVCMFSAKDTYKHIQESTREETSREKDSKH